MDMGSSSADTSAEKTATVPENHVKGDFDGDGQTDAGAIAINSVSGLKGIGNGKYYLGVAGSTLWLTGVDRSGIYLAFGKLTEMIAASSPS